MGLKTNENTTASTKKMSDLIPVITTYSFDRYACVRLFATDEAAKKYIRKSYKEELRIDREERHYKIKGQIDEDGSRAVITNHFNGHDDITEFQIGTLYGTDLDDDEMPKTNGSAIDSTKKMSNLIPVIITYSFNRNAGVRLFEKNKAAKKQLREEFYDHLLLDLKNGYCETECRFDEDGNYAKIVNHFDDHDAITEFRIGTMYAADLDDGNGTDEKAGQPDSSDNKPEQSTVKQEECMSESKGTASRVKIADVIDKLADMTRNVSNITYREVFNHSSEYVPEYLNRIIEHGEKYHSYTVAIEDILPMIDDDITVNCLIQKRYYPYNTPDVVIMSGYALKEYSREDRRWEPHTWLYSRGSNTVIETNGQDGIILAYYGVVLVDCEIEWLEKEHSAKKTKKANGAKDTNETTGSPDNRQKQPTAKQERCMSGPKDTVGRIKVADIAEKLINLTGSTRHVQAFAFTCGEYAPGYLNRLLSHGLMLELRTGFPREATSRPAIVSVPMGDDSAANCLLLRETFPYNQPHMAIMTGYALKEYSSIDSRWELHTWFYCKDANVIFEMTSGSFRYLAYYGVALTYDEVKMLEKEHNAGKSKNAIGSGETAGETQNRSIIPTPLSEMKKAVSRNMLGKVRTVDIAEKLAEAIGRIIPDDAYRGVFEGGSMYAPGHLNRILSDGRSFFNISSSNINIEMVMMAGTDSAANCLTLRRKYPYNTPYVDIMSGYVLKEYSPKNMRWEPHTWFYNKDTDTIFETTDDCRNFVVYYGVSLKDDEIRMLEKYIDFSPEYEGVDTISSAIKLIDELMEAAGLDEGQDKDTFASVKKEVLKQKAEYIKERLSAL